MKYATVFGVLWIAASTMSCGGAPDYTPKPKSGAVSHYTIQFQAILVGAQTGKATARVMGEETINGKTYKKTIVAFTGIAGLDQTTAYNRYDADGEYEIDGKHRDIPEYLVMPLPIAVGKAWSAMTGDGKKNFKAESIEAVLINDKTYDACLKVTYMMDGGVQGTDYYAPGVGLVKSIFNSGLANVTLTLDSK